MRSQFVTKTGVIAATVGSAVGLGNIWRFPYEAGVHGGGAFLLLYILCVLVIGVPVMVAEFSIGRGTHKNALGAFRQLSPRSPFRVVAYMGIAASLMILSFYS
ncbi:MAG: sodium-dependent transporter, partial [Muribaculaceae bacterium]|nr:sodium-dependent transporter [Muribaculaceae bacterium]